MYSLAKTNNRHYLRRPTTLHNALPTTTVFNYYKAIHPASWKKLLGNLVTSCHDVIFSLSLSLSMMTTNHFRATYFMYFSDKIKWDCNTSKYDGWNNFYLTIWSSLNENFFNQGANCLLWGCVRATESVKVHRLVLLLLAPPVICMAVFRCGNTFCQRRMHAPHTRRITTACLPAIFAIHRNVCDWKLRPGDRQPFVIASWSY